MPKVKLHRCPINTHIGFVEKHHACARVQEALDRKAVEYEVVKEPLRPGKRVWIKDKTNQDRLPVIEFEDGSTYREESKGMAARVDAGDLFDGQSDAGHPSSRAMPTTEA